MGIVYKKNTHNTASVIQGRIPYVEKYDSPEELTSSWYGHEILQQRRDIWISSWQTGRGYPEGREAEKKEREDWQKNRETRMNMAESKDNKFTRLENRIIK